LKQKAHAAAEPRQACAVNRQGQQQYPQRRQEHFGDPFDAFFDTSNNDGERERQ